MLLNEIAVFVYFFGLIGHHLKSGCDQPTKALAYSHLLVEGLSPPNSDVETRMGTQDGS